MFCMALSGIPQRWSMLMLDDRLIPAQEYHNRLMKQIDDAYWIGEAEEGEFLQREADHIKKHYLDEGEVWYPSF